MGNVLQQSSAIERDKEKYGDLFFDFHFFQVESRHSLNDAPSEGLNITAQQYQSH